jgi:hypothetical protein
MIHDPCIFSRTITSAGSQFREKFRGRDETAGVAEEIAGASSFGCYAD